MRIVIAMGGNALLPKDSKGTSGEQMAAAGKALHKLSSLFDSHQIALTHGNGPQVGSLLLQQHASKKVPEMPLDVLDAMTQGEIGYFIQSSLKRKSAVLLTRVVVDPLDPAFKNPSKPVGPFYKTKPQDGNRKQVTYIMDSGRGYRQVVPSPKAKGILEKDAILTLMKDGFVVVCGGGGGIPVTKSGKGVAAVIDKDDLSSLLASTVKADLLVFITSVDSVYTDFRKKSQKPLRKSSVSELKRLTRAGHFAPGSMKPKVEAVMRFIENGGKKAMICSIDNLSLALRGKAGTTVTQ